MDSKEIDILRGEGHIMKKYCISKDYTIKEAIESIERFHNRVVVVVDDYEKVLGIVSQGDVIRALIEGKNLYSHVQTIIRPNFFYLNNRDIEAAYRLFRKHQITLLPIVDNEFHLVDVISMNDIYDYMEEK